MARVSGCGSSLDTAEALIRASRVTSSATVSPSVAAVLMPQLVEVEDDSNVPSRRYR